jgi:prefoldin subunit 2
MATTTTKSSSSSSSNHEELDENAIVELYHQLREEYNQLAQKIAEVEMDKNEHLLVLDVLRPLEPTRKCYRMVGGVLVERTASEIIPALTNTIDGMTEILKRMNDALKAKAKEQSDHVAKYNLKIKGSQDIKNQTAAAQDTTNEGKKTAGLLA